MEIVLGGQCDNLYIIVVCDGPRAWSSAATLRAFLVEHKEHKHAMLGNV